MNIVYDMLEPGIPLAEKIIRPIIVYIFLVAALRLAGKRELGQINTFDLIVLLTLSNTVQNAIIGNDNSLLGGVVGASTLLFVNYILVRFLYAHPILTRVIEGEPDVLISHGKVNRKKLEQEGITLQELEATAHHQGFASLNTIETAVLESSGAISFISKKPTEESLRHREVIQRLDQLAESVKQLQQEVKDSK